MKATPKLPEPAVRPIDHDAGKEPASDIEMLGAMLEDNRTMALLLRELPYERTHYRSNLRLVAGAAIRTRQRCEKLLGEDMPAHRDILDRAAARPHFTAAAAATAFNNAEPGSVLYVDEPDAEPADTKSDGKTKDPGVNLGPVSSNRTDATEYVERANQKNGAHKYGITESFIMGAIADAGAATTSELLRLMIVKHSIPSSETNDALANLRTAGKVVTTRMGKGYINRLAV